MIGLSLSRCVREIAEGKVRLEQVEKIVAGIRAINDDAWILVISTYAQTVWRDCADEARRICALLWKAGKIEQPLLGPHKRCPRVVGGVIWVEKESDILWDLPVSP